MLQFIRHFFAAGGRKKAGHDRRVFLGVDIPRHTVGEYRDELRLRNMRQIDPRIGAIKLQIVWPGPFDATSIE